MMASAEIIVMPGVRIERGEGGTDLLSYEHVCTAVAALTKIPDVCEYSSRADAVRDYARRAGNRQLEIDAAQARILAERRAGEILIAMRKTGELHTRGRPVKCSDGEHLPATLEDLGLERKFAAHAQKLAQADDFDQRLENWRGQQAESATRVSVDILKARAPKGPRHENDFYPSPMSIIHEVCARWKPANRTVIEPCCGDGRFADQLETAGFDVERGDITTGQDFFDRRSSDGRALCTNPPFDRAREFLLHAFAVGFTDVCLILPERFWSSGVGREQFEGHRPRVWANMDWREDYLQLGGSPDRALAVAIWDIRCADHCEFEVWDRRHQP